MNTPVAVRQRVGLAPKQRGPKLPQSFGGLPSGKSRRDDRLSGRLIGFGL